MRNAILLISTLFGANLAFSQGRELSGKEADAIVPGAEVVWMQYPNAAPAYVRLRTERQPKADFIARWIRTNLKFEPGVGLSLLNTTPDELGFTHYRFQQTIHNLPVEGSMYIVHEKDGQLHSCNGEMWPSANTATTPSLTESQALDFALNHVNADLYMWENEANEDAIKREQQNLYATFFPKGQLVVLPTRTANGVSGFNLAWKFDVYAEIPFGRQWIYVNAHTGAILTTQERIHTADTPGTANTRYSGTQAFTTDAFGGSYRLRETGRGNGIATYNLQRTSNYGGAVDFTDANNIWSNVNANQDEVATDAHWGAEKTYDYFSLIHGRNSIDGNGFNLISYVHYNTNYNNAFWDGSRMTYGDGDGSVFTPLTGLDVTGHEITHGLTEFTAGLVYSYESGALNESFSDIFGNTIENYARPAQWNWKIGEDITPGGGGLRSMQNPNANGDPDTYTGTNWYTGTGDNGGVHTNSGVQNKWYYILTIGETGTNDLGQGYNVTGQGWVKARAIAFRSLTMYLTPGSNYAAARFYSIQAAIDIYGPCTAEVIATTNAWRAVGVGAPFSSTVIAAFTGSPLVSCSAPTTVQFSNNSVTAGSYLWNFGDGGTSTAISPSHTYAAFGNYTVTLIGYAGACGNDTTVVSNYISIQPTNACSYTLIGPNGPNFTQTACAGSIFDTGGPTGDYLDNTNSTVTISPPGAATVTLTFASFNFEANYDYLYIYNGPTIASPLIGAYTGTTLPNGGTVSSTTGSITIRQYTDGGVTAPGFAANWNCVMPTTPPVVNFVADETNSCSGIINFTDQSTNGATSWAWNFGDGFTSTLQHPSHTYVNNGVYTVTLVATNSIGNAQLIRTNYITVAKPAGPTATGASRCGPGTVTLTTVNANAKEWYDAASGGNLVGTGNSFTTPVLTNSINYYVEQLSTNPVNSTVGPVTNTLGTGGYHNNASIQYQIFDVISPVTLVSVRVYASGTSSRTISLWNSAGTLIRDTTLSIANGTQTVTLNWALTVGSGFRLGGSNMNLYRNNASAAYPYSLPGKVVITGSSAGSAFYYYFYNWQIKGAPCRSLRTVVPVTINSIPNISISPTNATYCNGVPAVLTASGGTSYVWSNAATTPSINVSTAGNYTVTGTDVNGCSATSAAATVTLSNPTVTLSPSGTVNICPSASVTITAPAGSNYSWSNGATTSSITVSSGGTYTVTMTTSGGCTGIVSAPVTVVVGSTPTPNITPAGPQAICAGNSITLTADPGTAYLWSNGATTQSISVNTAGSYNVTVTYAGGCMGVSASTVVTVNSLPTATITPSGPTTFCTGGNVTLSANAASSWLWSNGATTQSVNATSSGSYSVTITNANGCPDSEGPVTVTVNPLPIAVITPNGPTSFCNGGSVILTSNSGSSYSWSNSATTQGITVTSSGIYTLTLTDGNGCTDTEQATVNVFATPNATITPSGPTTFCSGGTVDLSSDPGSAYSWSTTESTQSITVNSSGTYTLSFTDVNGCTDTESIVVTVNAAPSVIINAGGPTTFCDGGSVVLTANGGSSWDWNNSATTQSITVTTSDTYTVTATDGNGCEGMAQQVVVVNPNPNATFTQVENLLVVDFIDASTGATSWDWDFGDLSTSSSQNPSHTYASAGTYTVTLIVTNSFGCTDTITQTVTVIALGVQAGVDFNTLGVFPNPFSNQVTVNLELATAGELCIEMHDLTGRKVGQWHCKETSSGFHSIPCEVVPMASGTYLLKVTLNGSTQVVRMVKQ
jgi:Zn-dependent metalloprotease